MVTRSTMYSRPSAGWAIPSCSTGEESVKDAVDEVSQFGMFQVEVQGGRMKRCNFLFHEGWKPEDME